MILITGATGLVGSHLLLQLLENRQPVRAIYRTETSLEKTRLLFAQYGKSSLLENAQWLQADILDIPSLEPAFENINQVYHCAALVSFDPGDEQLLRKTNIEGTANMVNLSMAYGVEKFCYVSSIAALGDLKSDETTIDEDTEWNPEVEHSDYAISKHGAEMEVWRGWQEGLRVSIVNPGVIIGPGFWEQGSGKLFSRVAAGLSFFTKGFTGWISVGDVVKVMIQSMKNPQNERYVLVAENLSYETVLHLIAEALQVKAPQRYAAPWMTTFYWRWDALVAFLTGKKRILSRITARTLHEQSYYSNGKIKSVLGLEFEPVRKAISSAAEYFPK